MLARARSVALIGVDAVPVEVEVDVSPGLPAFTVVGLPDQAVSEARERVRAAVRNAGLPFPAARITVNLAPADLRKEGPLYDLPIALGLLAAQEMLPADALSGVVSAGELALDGSLRPIAGAVNLALLAAQEGRPALLPAENAAEAALIEGVTVYGAGTLLEAVRHLSGQAPLPETEAAEPVVGEEAPLDLADIKGQAGGEAGAGDRARGWAQPVVDRLTRQWQDHARPPRAGPVAAPDPGGSAGSHAHPLRCRAAHRAGRPGRPAALPLAAPHRERRGPDRRWQRAQAG